ncbi:hypothetical protein Misp01_05710 [Microtetraspora sp. NBRC 13810]|uniref:hypothetical protein n=1 Tax=Microtetraspora sp. NBRC 13810 TaxID=3030990 RepID=UPI0024A31250|nr:hypothetical protein [Microtetraspora sp. NBRC 13810]GLW05441.1 hypothetical protein Misp01_05710 [Microtetraspora sp. NBRC 13810]
MKRLPALALALAAMIAFPALPAEAAPAPPGTPYGEGWQEGRRAGVTLRNSEIVITGDGVDGGRGDGYRVPQPCWYEPGPSAEEMLSRQQGGSKTWHMFNRANPDVQADFEEHLSQYEERVGEDGRWWSSAANDADPDAASCYADLPPYVWVPEGETPAAGITMQELADLARAALTVPEPQIRLNPAAKSYVNLDTWVWLEGAGDTSRSVTATLPGVMSATVTATMDSLEIDPGTEEWAKVVDEGCGQTGTPYTPGGELTCGVRYLRASLNEPREVYELTVTSIWEITGEGEGGIAPFAYDPIEVGATVDVPVGEVQSTVRRSGS